MSVTVANLDYAPRPPTRRRVVRRVLASILLAGTLVASLRWGPQAWRIGQVMYFQHQCLTDAPPADQIVYEEDPALFARVMKQGSGFVPLAPSRRSGAPVAVGRVPQSWIRFTPSLMKMTRPLPGAILFMHERQTPAGEKRLLVVFSGFDPAQAPPLFIPGFDLDVNVIAPATFRTPARDVSPPCIIDVLFSHPRTPPMSKVYAGQADPADPTHFTIRYEMYGKTGIVDGWLRDHDRVEIKVRDGPNPFGN